MFIIIEGGAPTLERELPQPYFTRLAAMNRVWSHWVAFDAHHRYKAQPVIAPTISVVQRLLAHTVYNPKVEVPIRWTAEGESSLSEIISHVEDGLKSDDDIIQQWFEGPDVIRLLRSATTFEEMCDRVACVCGRFESDSRLHEIVEATLGQKSEKT